jgi:hypothetical protein
MKCGLYHDPPPSELPGHGSALAGALYGALAKQDLGVYSTARMHKLNFSFQLQFILYRRKYMGIALLRQASFALNLFCMHNFFPRSTRGSRVKRGGTDSCAGVFYRGISSQKTKLLERCWKRYNVGL